MAAKHPHGKSDPEDEPRITAAEEEPPPPGPIDVGEGGGQSKPVAPREPRPPEGDERLIYLLPADRQGPGELVKVPADQFGFAITVNDVLYVHVSDADDGTWQFIPFSAK